MKAWFPLFLVVVLVAGVCAAGCTDQSRPRTTASYQIDSQGVLHMTVPPAPVDTVRLNETADLTVDRVIFHTEQGDVYGLAVSPVSDPIAALVLAPGAGVKKEAYQEIAGIFAREGCVFLVLDIRGNGGETAGTPIDLNTDFNHFTRGEWPQWYTIAADLVHARQYLSDRYKTPVYFVGESNGGRYAATAAALDGDAAGYVGISTSGFGLSGADYPEQARLFLNSIDPDSSVGRIAPRPVWIFHAQGDTVIPFEAGRKLYEQAGAPREFIPFNGTHGMNGEVVEGIISRWAQIYRHEGRINGSS